MTDLYFGLKMLCALLGIGLSALVFVILFAGFLTSSIRESRADKYLKSIGFKRHILSVSAFGNGYTYGYVRDDESGRSEVICDDDIKHMSLREIKKTYM